MKSEIAKAVRILKQGGLVAFPTETVYGLGADARNPEALLKIFAAKQRPVDHPLIVHLSALSQLSSWAVDVSESALKIAAACWPGPLTLILKKAPGVSDLVTGKQDTIGIRIPNHPIALTLLDAMDGGLAAPSANRFGRISPTTADAVREELGDAVDLILDGGSCAVGVESTILDMSGEQSVILRPGMISAKQIEKILKQPVLLTRKNKPRVSGSMESHYAPQTKTELILSETILLFLKNITKQELPLVFMTRKNFVIKKIEGVEWIAMPLQPENYAHELYGVLRALDKKNFRRIMIEEVPEEPEWDAIRDRVQRAAGGG